MYLFLLQKSISACLYQSVTLMMRSRRSVDHALQPHDDTVTQGPNVLHRYGSITIFLSQMKSWKVFITINYCYQNASIQKCFAVNNIPYFFCFKGNYYKTAHYYILKDDPKINYLHRTLEILHMATLCLLSFSPDLLSLLADPGLDLERWQPLVELHFGAPKISYEPFPQLTFGTLVTAICLLTRSLNHVS